MAIVVSDTSPIRALQHLGLLSILSDLYGTVLLPDVVADELRRPGRLFPPLDPSTFPFFTIVTPRDQIQVAALQAVLDAGEAAAIVLAIESAADVLLMDERLGRREARKLGLKTVGVLAILATAKEKSLIPAIRPLIDQLRAGLDFHLSAKVIAEILQRVGE